MGVDTVSDLRLLGVYTYARAVHRELIRKVPKPRRHGLASKVVAQEAGVPIKVVNLIRAQSPNCKFIKRVHLERMAHWNDLRWIGPDPETDVVQVKSDHMNLDQAERAAA